jgi:serine/threonine protein kinase
LKPANIKVRPDGTVKVLDFGLAKAMEPAPEQARGKTVDKRADIWAFGAVLFEMLTGTRAFSGDETTYTIAAVISKEPGWDAMPAATSGTGDSSPVAQLEARPTSSPDRDSGRTNRAPP